LRDLSLKKVSKGARSRPRHTLNCTEVDTVAYRNRAKFLFHCIPYHIQADPLKTETYLAFMVSHPGVGPID